MIYITGSGCIALSDHKRCPCPLCFTCSYLSQKICDAKTCWEPGAVAADGGIACSCQQCKGTSVSCSLFEEHAGSKDRRPGESIYLTDAGLSLKTLVQILSGDDALLRHPPALLDARAAVCAVCWHPGKLAACATCGTTVHPTCAGLAHVPEVLSLLCSPAAAGCVQQAGQEDMAAPPGLAEHHVACGWG